MEETNVLPLLALPLKPTISPRGKQGLWNISKRKSIFFNFLSGVMRWASRSSIYCLCSSARCCSALAFSRSAFVRAARCTSRFTSDCACGLMVMVGHLTRFLRLCRAHLQRCTPPYLPRTLPNPCGPYSGKSCSASGQRPG